MCALDPALFETTLRGIMERAAEYLLLDGSPQFHTLVAAILDLYTPQIAEFKALLEQARPGYEQDWQARLREVEVPQDPPPNLRRVLNEYLESVHARLMSSTERDQVFRDDDPSIFFDQKWYRHHR